MTGAQERPTTEATGGPPASGRPSPPCSPTPTSSARRRTCTPLLRDGGDKVGLATVYRNLQAMAADGEVDVLRTDDGEAVYRACSTGHHHHLVCRVCGRTVEVEGPTVEAWATGSAPSTGSPTCATPWRSSAPAARCTTH